MDNDLESLGCGRRDGVEWLDGMLVEGSSSEVEEEASVEVLEERDCAWCTAWCSRLGLIAKEIAVGDSSWAICVDGDVF